MPDHGCRELLPPGAPRFVAFEGSLSLSSDFFDVRGGPRFHVGLHLLQSNLCIGPDLLDPFG
jgi:hypothetical protein